MPEERLPGQRLLLPLSAQPSGKGQFFTQVFVKNSSGLYSCRCEKGSSLPRSLLKTAQLFTRVVVRKVVLYSGRCENMSVLYSCPCEKGQFFTQVAVKTCQFFTRVVVRKVSSLLGS